MDEALIKAGHSAEFLRKELQEACFHASAVAQAELDKTEGLVRKNNFFNKHQNAK